MWNPCIRTGLLAIVFVLHGCSYVQTKLEPVIPAANIDLASPEVEESYRQCIQLMRAKQWKQAGSQLQSITEQYPQYAGPWLNLGITRMKLGNKDGAEAAFRTAIDLNPDNPVGYNKLGILYRQAGRLDEALTMYKSALQAAPDHPDTHWNIGILYELYLADADLALQHYMRYQSLTGSNDPQLQTWIKILRKKTNAPA